MKGCCNYKFWGYGIIIWAVAFIVASIFIAFETSAVIMNTVTALAVVLTAFLLAKTVSLASRKAMLKYSFCWVIVVFILDALVTSQFTAWDFLSSWYVWLAYALILFVPLLAVKVVSQPSLEQKP